MNPTIIRVEPRHHYTAELIGNASKEMVAKVTMQYGGDSVRLKFPLMNQMIDMNLKDWDIFKSAVDDVIMKATAPSNS